MRDGGQGVGDPLPRPCGRPSRASAGDSAGGGDVICIEAVHMPGAGALTLSGRVGEVMQESARTALPWLRANAGRYGLDASFHREADLHLHVQSSAAHNDGASAGVTMAAALVAACTGRAVREDLAMTGEITLSGQVLPVGGIQERCSRRTVAGWPASSCRGRTASRSTRTSATTSGARWKSTT